MIDTHFCFRCKTPCPEDFHTITLIDNFCRAEPYTRITTCKESEATFCVECADLITATFWGQQ
jgi:hypothetical protein